MPEPLYDVQYLFRAGGGIRPEWRTWAANLPKLSAEKLAGIQRLRYDAPADVWRVVPALRRDKKRRRPLHNVADALCKAVRTLHETRPVSRRRPSQTVELTRDKRGFVTIRMGGAR